MAGCKDYYHTSYVPTVIDSAGCSDFVPCRCKTLDDAIRAIGIELVESHLNISRDGLRWRDDIAIIKGASMMRLIRSTFSLMSDMRTRR